MAFTSTQLQEMIDSGAQEGQYLEFKRGSALGASSESRKELVKDCTGFANANGGVILYGVAEEEIDGIPTAASLSPVADPKINGDWITNVIRSNTSPPLNQFEITELAVSGGRVIAIQIESALTTHQNLIDRRYYQRAGRTIEPMVDFQIRDVMNRRLRPAISIDHKFANVERSQDLHRYALQVLMSNIGSVTLEHWQFEIDIPCDVIRDTRPPITSELDGLLNGWSNMASLAQGPDNQRVLRITRRDPDEDYERRLILHPGQTRTLFDYGALPEIIIEIDHAIWSKVHGRSIFWRILMPNTQPITGEWAFDDWCSF